ncbi:hypothetical protein Tco_0231769 [Tanacetum coccineum]
MSTQAEPIPTPPTSAVRNTVGKGNEQTPENPSRLKEASSRRPRSTSSPEPTLSVFSRIRRDGSKSPRHRDFEREAVFTRLGRKEKGVFNRLRGKGRSVSARSSDSKTQRHRNAQREAESHYQSSYSRKAELIPRKRYHEGTSSRRTEAFSESEDCEGGR